MTSGEEARSGARWVPWAGSGRGCRGGQKERCPREVEGPALRGAGRGTVAGGEPRRATRPGLGSSRWPVSILFRWPQREGWLVTARRTAIFAPRPLNTVWLTRCKKATDRTIFHEASEEGAAGRAVVTWSTTFQALALGAVTTAPGEAPPREPGERVLRCTPAPRHHDSPTWTTFLGDPTCATTRAGHAPARATGGVST